MGFYLTAISILLLHTAANFSYILDFESIGFRKSVRFVLGKHYQFSLDGKL